MVKARVKCQNGHKWMSKHGIHGTCPVDGLGVVKVLSGGDEHE